jgi:hypothetical protein
MDGVGGLILDFFAQSVNMHGDGTDITERVGTPNALTGDKIHTHMAIFYHYTFLK